METLDRADIDRVIGEIARVTPVWDFGRPQWLSDRADLWWDRSHYTRAVAAMMVNRMFGVETEAPRDFGILRGGPDHALNGLLRKRDPASP
jgi:hypothetical protein